MNTAIVEYDSKLDEYVLIFPEGMLEEMGWDEGDTLKWIDNGDGSWAIKKVNSDASKAD